MTLFKTFKQATPNKLFGSGFLAHKAKIELADFCGDSYRLRINGELTHWLSRGGGDWLELEMKIDFKEMIDALH